MTGLIAIATLAIAGCATGDPKLQQLGDSLHTNPLVTVRFDIVSVTAEPIVLDLRDKDSSISWHAPLGYTFDGAGVEFAGLLVDADGRAVQGNDPDALKSPNLKVNPDGKSAFNCTALPQVVTCLPVRGRIVVRGVYRYSIILRDKDGKQLKGDPHVTPNL
jgi:hypothetical protein